ncbi:MAG: DUF4364 family protein [Clostridia bacterium]|nr:DUF4364 family protein [Clostridia bacterium]
MEFNAQTAGVRPGGLNNREQINIMICGVLKKFSDLDESVLLEAIYDGQLANQFEMQRALATLKERGIITETLSGGERLLNITETGKAAYEELKNLVPKSVREDSLLIVDETLRRKKRLREARFALEEKGDEFYFRCTIYDRDVDLMAIKLLVPSKEIANQLRENIIKGNPAFIYKSIVSLLGNDIEGFLEYYDNLRNEEMTKKYILED